MICQPFDALAADSKGQKQLGHATITHSQPSTPDIPLKTHYTDASSFCRKSGSPTFKTSNPVGRPRNDTFNVRKRLSQPHTPSASFPSIRQNYVNSSMQTESEEEDPWYNSIASPFVAKRPYMSLTKRLLLRSQQDRAILEERRKFTVEHSEVTIANGADARDLSRLKPVPINVDIEMLDVESALTLPLKNVVEEANSSIACPVTDRSIATGMKPPPPLTIDQIRALNGYRSNDLRVQLPPKPSVSSDSASNTPLVETPTSTISQSPFSQISTAVASSFPHSSSGLVQPSPIKKKVSLGEYFSRRKGSQPATEIQANGSPTMSVGNLKRPPLMNGILRDGESQAHAVVDTSKGEENDVTDQDTDPKS